MLNIKLILGGIVATIMTGLYVMLGHEKGKRQEAESKAKVYKDATTENVKELQRLKEAEKVAETVNHLDAGDVDGELLKYARDRHQD